MNILDKIDIFTPKRRQLIGALVGLAKTSGNKGITDETTKILMNGLISLHPMSCESEDELNIMINKVQAQKNKLSPQCNSCESKCGNTDDYNFEMLLEEATECQNLKEKILLTLLETPVANIELFYRAIAIIGCQTEEKCLEEIYSTIKGCVEE